MKRLLTYLKRHPLATLFAPLFKMLEASFELFVPLVVAKMIDIGIYQKNAGYLWYGKMQANIIRMLSKKNLVLSNRIFCTTPKKIRDRVYSYLSMQRVRSGCRKFKIPFNRQQMADYLNLDRSALSKELGLMQEEGILSFYKNEFELLEAEEYDVKR